MVKEKLGKIIRRIFYIIFALLISVALWVYIEITENEIQRREIANIEVVLRNEDILGDRDLFIEGEIPTISFTVEAPRSDIAALLVPGAVTVEVDLMNVFSAGDTSLSYEIGNWPPRVNRDVILFGIPGRVLLTIGIHSEKRVEVLVDSPGVADGYLAGQPEFDPQVITIHGPEDIIERIDHVRVPVNRENLTTTFTDYLEFLLFDEDGVVIELEDDQRELISFSQDTIRVTIPVSELKMVSLQVVRVDGATTSLENTLITIIPDEIQVSGDPETLRGFNALMLGNIDMMSFTGLRYVMELPIQVPEGIENISREEMAIITIEIRDLEVQSRNVSNFQGTRLHDDLGYEIQTRVHPVMIRGTQEDLAEITEMNITLVADLYGLEIGVHRVAATVHLHGVNGAVDVVGDYTLIVRIFDPLMEPIATEP